MRFPLAVASDDDLPARAGDTLRDRVLANELMVATTSRYGVPESLENGSAAGNGIAGENVEVRPHCGLSVRFRGTG